MEGGSPQLGEKAITQSSFSKELEQGVFRSGHRTMIDTKPREYSMRSESQIRLNSKYL